jgi:hypothetical protein
MTYYTDKEILRKALTALESCSGAPHWEELQPAVTAIKQALADSALDRMAENARELGLDYEPAPVPMAHIVGEIDHTGKVWKPVQPAPVQEPVAWAMYQRGRLQSFWLDKGDAYDFEFTSEHEWKPLYTTPPAAQPAPVQPVASLKEVDVLMMAEAHGIDPSTKGLYGFYIDCISNQPAAQPAPVQEPVAMPENWFAGMPEEYRKEAWRVTTPPAAQPAIPDALFRHAPEHPQYIEGWNDCRAEMLKGMKP